MLNLLKKIQLIQFLIIIFFFTLSSRSIDKPIINKTSEYYNYLLNIIKYNDIFKEKNLTNGKLHPIILEKNDYMFYYYNKYNVSALFFKEKNTDIHHIYFNGINNIKDINLIIKIFSKSFTFKNIENLLNKNGMFYTVIDDKIEEVELMKDKSILEAYDFIHENIYLQMKDSNSDSNSNCEKINLKINGYSFGGPLSQIFIYILCNKYGNLLNIENYNIESWFAGSEEDLEDYKKIVKFYNIYNKKSVLYFYNMLFQKHFDYDYLIDSPKSSLESDIDPYIGKLFPNGIIKYIKDNHLLKKIIK